MKEIIVWLIHTPAGTIGLVSATVALLSKKGTALHRKAGTCFTISMLIMLISGFVAAALKQSPDDMFLAAVVAYTVFTAWLTAHHKNSETGSPEQVALLWIIAVAVAALFLNLSWREANTPNVYVFWAIFAVFCAVGDFRNLSRSGLSSIQRIIRHVWRMGFSLIWAVLALTDKILKMRGYNVKEMPEEQLPYIIVGPIILILALMAYWIINVSFFSRKEFSSYDNQAG